MDLQLASRVLWRFKWLVIGGMILGVVLAVLSFVRVDVNGHPAISYRKHETWAATSRVLVAQPGFRLGNSLTGPATPADTTDAATQAAAEARLPSLATLYATFVTGDAVNQILKRSCPIKGKITAASIPGGPSNSQVLPIVSITATGTSPTAAASLSNRAAAALATWVDSQQAANGVPRNSRILLRGLNRAGEDPNTLELIGPRSKTLPVVVFLAVAFAAIGLAFLLENLRPRRRAPSLRDDAAHENADLVKAVS
jgi:hypothetical protein